MASYVYGNVVRKPSPTTQKQVGQSRHVNKRAKARRRQPMHANRGYVMFLAVAAVVALFACVQYLQLQSNITNRSHQITSLQQELADVKEENTTRYNAIMNTMNLEEIRRIAMDELGMVPAQADQIVKYQSPKGSSMVQYAGIPKSGVVASSDVIE